MKFDNIVGNPPYQKGSHLKVFNKSFELLRDRGNLIFIHPSTPFLNQHGIWKLKPKARVVEIVSEYKSQLKFINGTKIFNVDFTTPLSITFVKKIKDKNIKVIDNFLGNTVNNYNTIHDIYLHGDKIVLGIRDKIFSKTERSIMDVKLENQPYHVSMLRISGHPPKNGKLNPDFYQLVYKTKINERYNRIVDSSIPIPKEHSRMSYVPVDSYNHGKNFVDYLLTKFARFCVSLTKVENDFTIRVLRTLPYLDFSEKWDDEKLFKYFEFTDEEIKYIINYIPNWYEEDFKKYPKL